MREETRDHWVVLIGMGELGGDTSAIGLIGTSVTATTEAEAIAELSGTLADGNRAGRNKLAACFYRNGAPEAFAADFRDAVKRLGVPEERLDGAVQSFLQFYSEA